MLTVLCGIPGRLSLPCLAAALRAHEQREAQCAYQAQLLWQQCHWLGALLGQPDSLPDYFTLFPPPCASVRADAVRTQVLGGLTVMDGEPDHAKEAKG